MESAGFLKDATWVRFPGDMHQQRISRKMKKMDFDFRITVPSSCPCPTPCYQEFFFCRCFGILVSNLSAALQPQWLPGSLIHPWKAHWNLTFSKTVLLGFFWLWVAISLYKHHLVVINKLYHRSCYICFLTTLQFLESLFQSCEVLSPSPQPSSCTVCAQEMLAEISSTKAILSWDEGLRLQE